MRASFFILALYLLAPPGTTVASISSCESCHGSLDRANAEPVRVWDRDLHRQSGMGCPDCHGGDPESLRYAMEPGRGFVGAPGGEQSVKLCGGCHSDPDAIADPATATDQFSQYRAGLHSGPRQKGGPTCVTCHGSHGIVPVAEPSSPVFRTRVVDLCLSCHGPGGIRENEGSLLYLQDVHGRAVVRDQSPKAPTCADCHGAHRASVPSAAAVQLVCGRCHTMEYEHLQSGPHGEAVRATGGPSCVHCHGSHGMEAAGLSEIIGRVTDNCGRCHVPGSRAWKTAYAMDRELGVAMTLLDSLRDKSSEFRLAGLETGEMDRQILEAYGWLQQVESAIHSVDTDWEELTGMAKVKMMAAWDLARDYSLEKGIRRVVLLVVALLASSICALLVFKLKLVERDRRRRRTMGGPGSGPAQQEDRKR